MSFASGLNSKLQESAYWKLVESLIELLSDRVMKAISKQSTDDQVFSKRLVTIYTKMSRVELQKTNPPKLSNYFHDLSMYLSSIYPDTRCNSSDSSHARSDNSQPSPIPFDSLIHNKAYLHQPLDEIQEEDTYFLYKSEQNPRFHSQPRKIREISPTKPTFKHSLIKTQLKPEDIMGKYLKMSEKFSEKKGKKEESLYFSNGIFFHIP